MSAEVLLQSIPPFRVGPELMMYPVNDVERAFKGTRIPEAVRMYLAIIRESPLGPGSGWFGPAEQRYTWDWLARRHGVSVSDAILPEQFQGSSLAFHRLDRNRDGMISAEDLDWSDSQPWVEQANLISRLFRRIDSNSDGSLSRDDWMNFFDMASARKNEITVDELREAWMSGLAGGFFPGDAPTKDMLLDGLFSGELGSQCEGPGLNEPAPDFTLRTHDGVCEFQLSKLIGLKPVVLIFGNFTCGPFRSTYPGIEAVYRRFSGEATFLAIYVREAHPTDGWKMESNSRVGVTVTQPKTYQERTTVAQQCHRLLRPAIPLLVDHIDDSAGNAYSGMPTRFYVIDTAGRVAYKSGRGPFGFKTGEMEQALAMTLLDVD